jgi:hypothetical protein
VPKVAGRAFSAVNFKNIKQQKDSKLKAGLKSFSK